MAQFRDWWGRHRKYKEKFSQEVEVAGRNEFRRIFFLGGQKKNTQEKGKSGSYSNGLFETPWCVPCQVPPSMGFSRQEYRSGFHFLLQEIFPTQGSNAGLPHCRQTLYCLSHQGNPGAMLNKSLIQSSVDGGTVFPPCSLASVWQR